jgi:hypothetical protein
MPVPLITVGVIISRLLPAIRELVKATTRKSPGGKKITRAERERILAALIDTADELLEDMTEDEVSPLPSSVSGPR